MFVKTVVGYTNRVCVIGHKVWKEEKEKDKKYIQRSCKDDVRKTDDRCGESWYGFRSIRFV